MLRQPMRFVPRILQLIRFRDFARPAPGNNQKSSIARHGARLDPVIFFRDFFYTIWYPLLNHPAAVDFLPRLVATGIPRIFRAELALLPRTQPGMTGSGM
ncbi:MAG: 23S rRNA (adenine(2030)-N(6))-methyltransferase RlmJ, partial [Gammaproteobacteria bacterium]|nr:23S rRNA (adenine(2030)-N(6))-methyltransferase RlmJ [Gammaproteobacteria bacterium]